MPAFKTKIGALLPPNGGAYTPSPAVAEPCAPYGTYRLPVASNAECSGSDVGPPLMIGAVIKQPACCRWRKRRFHFVHLATIEADDEMVVRIDAKPSCVRRKRDVPARLGTGECERPRTRFPLSLAALGFWQGRGNCHRPGDVRPWKCSGVWTSGERRRDHEELVGELGGAPEISVRVDGDPGDVSDRHRTDRETRNARRSDGLRVDVDRRGSIVRDEEPAGAVNRETRILGS